MNEMTEKPKSVWETLSRIDVSEHTESKNGFTYLSWAWAWKVLKDNYPDATFIKWPDNQTGLPYVKDADTGTCFVRVTVKAGGEEATEMFPVLDHRNKAIQNPNAMDVNTALQRCMTKAISYLGLGAYIYAGEDLPPAPKEAVVQGPNGATEKAEGVQMIATVFEKFLPSIKDVQSLEAFWVENQTAINILKGDQARYAETLTKFKHRKNELAKKEKTDA